MRSKTCRNVLAVVAARRDHRVPLDNLVCQDSPANLASRDLPANKDLLASRGLPAS